MVKAGAEPSGVHVYPAVNSSMSSRAVNSVRISAGSSIILRIFDIAVWMASQGTSMAGSLFTLSGMSISDNLTSSCYASVLNMCFH
jgi:hypothetical protein